MNTEIKELQQAKDYINACAINVAVGLLNIDRCSHLILEHSYEAMLSLLASVRAFLKNVQEENIERNIQVFRLMGDDFLIVADNEDGQAAQFLQAIQESISKECFKYEQDTAHVSASIGITHRKRKENATTLIKEAQQALLEAKQERNATSLFKKKLTPPPPTFSSNDLIAALEQPHSLERETGIQPFFQPIWRICDGKWSLAGFEVLIRLHSRNTLFGPQAIFNKAKQSGKGYVVEKYVIESAMHHFSEIPHPHPFSLSINLSPHHFKKAEKIKEILQIANTYGVPHERIRIELLEESLEFSEVVLRSIEMCKRQGVEIFIDDFGIESSLRHSSKFSANGLKIDKSFVPKSCEENPNIFAKLIEIGIDLGIGVVVEGIETAYQQQLLEDLEAEYRESDLRLYGQGYFFARPFKPQKLITFTHKHSP
jgi:EAL domain-containing protein (putative c-di-GMP-specific phosphodiesterase class I)/GGDEF domain-containing protein